VAKHDETKVDLAALKSRLEAYYRETFTQMGEDDAYYEQKPPLGMALPDGVPAHISSTATSIVDNMADQIRTDVPAIDLKPRTESDRDDVANLIKWAYDRFQHIRTWAEVDSFEQAKRDLLLRGAACIKVIVNPEYLDGNHDIEPFIVKPLDPLVVMPAPGATKPMRYMVESQRRTVVDMEQYDEWSDPKGTKLALGRRKADKLAASNPAREVEWLEYWSDGQYYIEADTEAVTDAANPYPRVPYVYEFSGLGREHADGNPVHKARGLLTDIHGELDAEIRIKTAWDAQWQYHVFPVLLVAANAQLAQKQLNVSAGRVVEYGPLGNQKPEWLQREPPDAAMITFLDRIEANLRRVSAPVLQGSGGGSEFGILEAMRIGQALKVISPVVRSLNRMASQVLSLMAEMAVELGLEFNIRGSKQRVITLKGEVFKDRNFLVNFESVDAAENDRRLLIGESLHDKGLISRRTFHEKYAKHIVEDSDEEASWLLSEGVEQQALESGVLLQAALQGIQQPVQQAVQAGASAVGASAGPAGPGIPGGAAAQQGTEALAASPGLAGALNPAAGVRSNVGG